MTALPATSVQVPFVGATTRKRLGTGTTCSVSLAPLSSTCVFCEPSLSVCVPIGWSDVHIQYIPFIIFRACISKTFDGKFYYNLHNVVGSTLILWDMTSRCIERHTATLYNPDYIASQASIGGPPQLWKQVSTARVPIGIPQIISALMVASYR